MHYEIELRACAYMDDGNSLLWVMGSSWNTLEACRTNAVPSLLTFISGEEARSYADRNRLGLVHIMRVTDGDERKVVETGPDEQALPVALAKLEAVKTDAKKT